MKTEVNEFDSTSAVGRCGAARLLRLLGVSENTSIKWQWSDMEAMFQHQLSAPLEFDLSGEALAGTTTRGALKDLSVARNAGINTFGALFSHNEPPLGLLKVSKDFFKGIAKTHSKDSEEHKVAYMCYLLSVIVARVRQGKRITNLKDSEFLPGIEWALKQDWTGKTIHNLLSDARPLFGKT